MWHDVITILLLENKKSSTFLVSFVTSQSGTNFNASRHASAALLHISWVLYMSVQSFRIIGSSETILSHIF